MSKNVKGLMDMDNSVVISGGRTIRGLNGNEKNRVKSKSRKKIVLKRILELGGGGGRKRQL